MCPFYCESPGQATAIRITDPPADFVGERGIAFGAGYFKSGLVNVRGNDCVLLAEANHAAKNGGSHVLRMLTGAFFAVEFLRLWMHRGMIPARSLDGTAVRYEPSIEGFNRCANGTWQWSIPLRGASANVQCLDCFRWALSVAIYDIDQGIKPLACGPANCPKQSFPIPRKPDGCSGSQIPLNVASPESCRPGEIADTVRLAQEAMDHLRQSGKPLRVQGPGLVVSIGGHWPQFVLPFAHHENAAGRHFCPPSFSFDRKSPSSSKPVHISPVMKCFLMSSTSG